MGNGEGVTSAGGQIVTGGRSHQISKEDQVESISASSNIVVEDESKLTDPNRSQIYGHTVFNSRSLTFEPLIISPLLKTTASAPATK